MGKDYRKYRQPDPHTAAAILAVLDSAVNVLNVGAGAGSYEPTDRQMTTVEPMRIYAEEWFGPVKPVIGVGGDDEAIHAANDSEYGLSAAIFSRDVHRALGIAARPQSGICHINGATVADEAQLPFGGVKGSGFGRFGGRAAIAEFTDLRWITIEDPRQDYPF